MARREFSASVKKAALARASKATGFPCCERCGVMLKKGKFAFDHRIADGLNGEPTLANCEVLCEGPGSCHAGKTTTQDVPNIARAKRRETREAGIKKTTGRALPGSKRSGVRKRMNGAVERWSD